MGVSPRASDWAGSSPRGSAGCTDGVPAVGLKNIAVPARRRPVRGSPPRFVPFGVLYGLPPSFCALWCVLWTSPRLVDSLPPFVLFCVFCGLSFAFCALLCVLWTLLRLLRPFVCFVDSRPPFVPFCVFCGLSSAFCALLCVLWTLLRLLCPLVCFVDSPTKSLPRACNTECCSYCNQHTDPFPCFFPEKTIFSQGCDSFCLVG